MEPLAQLRKLRNNCDATGCNVGEGNWLKTPTDFLLQRLCLKPAFLQNQINMDLHGQSACKQRRVNQLNLMITPTSQYNALALT